MSRLSALGLVALPCLLLACSGAREAEARKSAARVARAIEALRNAPNEMKGGPLTELARLPCVEVEVCATREACRGAYQRHVEALALTASAKEQVTLGDRALAGKLLISAEQSLGEAGRLVLDCVEREGALRRHYKL